MRGFRVLLSKEIQEQWRTRRLPVVAVVFLVVGLASPLLAYYTPQLLERFASDVQISLPTPTAMDAVDQLYGNLGLAALATVLLLAMGSVAREKETGLAAVTLTKPVSRAAYLAAKLAALTVTLGVSTLLAGAAAYVYTYALFEAPPVAGFLASTLLLLTMYLPFLAITFLGSTLLPSALAAAGVGFGAYVLLSVMSVMPVVGDLAPSRLTGPGLALAVGNPAHGYLGPLLFALGLTLACFAAAVAGFRRQAL